MAVLVVLALAAPAPAGERLVHSFAVPGNGSLELEVPIRWTESIEWHPGNGPGIRFTRGDGSALTMTLTVLPAPADPLADRGSSDWLASIVATSARASLGLSDDRELFLERLGDGECRGWYYSVTDRGLSQPAAGQFRTMTQGASAAGPFVLTATILTQQDSGEDLADALSLLRTARVSSREPDSLRVPGPVQRLQGSLGERYDLQILPGFETVSVTPLELRDAITGALLAITFDASAGKRSVREELRRLESEIERRSPNSWVLRRRSPALLGGRTSAHFHAVDELRDETWLAWAVPFDDAVATVSVRARAAHASEAERRARELLRSLTWR